MDADVVVVGAGAAGIAAALELHEHSLKTIVLEARDRIGGRVRWSNVGTVDVPAELGAEFIHGDAPETSAFLREAGLNKVETGEASWTCTAAGELIPADDDFTSIDIFEAARALNVDESVSTYLGRFDADPQTRTQARRALAFVEGFEAADPAVASARAIAEELRSGVDSATWRPAGGYAPLFAHLAERCRRAALDLRLETVVERVAWERGAVTLQSRRPDGGRATVRARCAIVTIPVGVLRAQSAGPQLEFAPPLPAETRAAIEGLEMGHAVRVTLAFRSPFWETLAGGRYRDAAFFRCEAGPYTAFWTQWPSRDRTIVAWAGGPRALALGGLPDRERVERARDEFGALFGETERARSECEGGVTHDWSVDPFARGAYSYVATGAGAARENLARSVEATLFFAGEATALDGQGGTVSGAFGTGTRAAREVARALKETCAR